MQTHKKHGPSKKKNKKKHSNGVQKPQHKAQQAALDSKRNANSKQDLRSNMETVCKCKFDNVNTIFIDLTTTLNLSNCTFTNVREYEKAEDKIRMLNQMIELTLPGVNEVFYCDRNNYTLVKLKENGSRETSDHTQATHPFEQLINKAKYSSDQLLVVTFDMNLRKSIAKHVSQKVYERSDSWFSFVRAKASQVDLKSIKEKSNLVKYNTDYSLIIDGNNMFHRLLSKTVKTSKDQAREINTKVLYALWQKMAKIKDIAIIYDYKDTKPLNIEKDGRKFIVLAPTGDRTDADDEIIHSLERLGKSHKTYLVTEDQALIGRASQAGYKGVMSCGEVLHHLVSVLSPQSLKNKKQKFSSQSIEELAITLSQQITIDNKTA